MRTGPHLRATIHSPWLCLVPLAIVVAILFGLGSRSPAAAQQNSGLSGGTRAAGSSFVPGIEDLPLMPGLAPVEPASTYFDSPEGRIVIAYAGGQLQRPAILSFYATTLPQLGWTALDAADYRRDGETLRIEVGAAKPNAASAGAADAALVRFTLSPQ